MESLEYTMNMLEVQEEPKKIRPAANGLSVLPSELLDLIFQHLVAWELFPFLLSRITHSGAKRALQAGFRSVKEHEDDHESLDLTQIVQKFKSSGQPCKITLRGHHATQKTNFRCLTGKELDGASISLAMLSFDPTIRLHGDGWHWFRFSLIEELCLSKQCLHQLTRVFFRYKLPKLTTLRIIFTNCLDSCLLMKKNDCYSRLMCLLAQLIDSTPKLKKLHIRGDTDDFWPKSHPLLPITQGPPELEEISLPAGLMAGLKAGLRSGLFGSRPVRQYNFYCRVAQDLFNSLKELTLLRSSRAKKSGGGRGSREKTFPPGKRTIVILLNKDYAMQGCHDAEGFQTMINVLLESWKGVPGVSVTTLDGERKDWNWKTVLTMEIELQKLFSN